LLNPHGLRIKILHGLQVRKKFKKNVNKIAMTDHIQCAQWGTIFLRPINTNAIVLGMKPHCDMKILHYFILYQLMLQDQYRTWNLI
jgi:hypothetical protein